MSELTPQRQNQLRKTAAYKSGKYLGRNYSRPHIAPHQLWCDCCNKPVEEYEESCAHSAGDSGKSRLYIRAYCHGETADVLFRFGQWHDAGFAGGKTINLFSSGEALGFDDAKPLKAVQQEPPKQLLLMDRRR